MLPNFELKAGKFTRIQNNHIIFRTSDIRYEKVYTSVDWRQKDIDGKVKNIPGYS